MNIRNTPEAKAAHWTVTDTEARKRGEQTGLRYPGSPRGRLDEYWMSGGIAIRCRRKHQ